MSRSAQRLFRAKHACHHAAAEAANAEAGWLLGSEDDEFDGAARLEAKLLQNANSFEAAEYADASVIEAGVGNGVDVRARADRSEVRFGAFPRAKVLPMASSQTLSPHFATEAFHISAGAQIGFAENDARHNRRLGLGDLRQRHSIRR